MTRRTFTTLASGTLAAQVFGQSRPITKLGIAAPSFSGGDEGGGRRTAMSMLDKSIALQAGGLQAQMNGDLAALRSKAEAAGLFLEGIAPLPRDGNMAGFETAVVNAKTVGASVVRVAALNGRRYETFKTLEAWNSWRDTTLSAIKLAVPIVEKHKMTMAMENHKDWTLEEFVRVLKQYNSEYVGVCLDFGNNCAMLDDPIDMVDTLAPWIKATHVKDMGVRPYDDGFLLSEVPLGQGYLDLAYIVGVIQKQNPKINWSLEMLTRDPLKVPCLTDAYWVPFPERNGKHLAKMLRSVQKNAYKTSLPVVTGLAAAERQKAEDENIKLCLSYFRDKLHI